MFINAVASIVLAFLGQASAQPAQPVAQPAAQTAPTAAPMDKATRKAALKDLEAKEKAEIAAVKTDKTLTKAQKHEKIKAIRQDHQAKHKAIKGK